MTLNASARVRGTDSSAPGAFRGVQNPCRLRQSQIRCLHVNRNCLHIAKIHAQTDRQVGGKWICKRTVAGLERVSLATSLYLHVNSLVGKCTFGTTV